MHLSAREGELLQTPTSLRYARCTPSTLSLGDVIHAISNGKISHSSFVTLFPNPIQSNPILSTLFIPYIIIHSFIHPYLHFVFS
mmetsp:Transcript_22421/g.33148  ORF Transcript_22421/g.33148 Transcript_22421/m.33148 type:complete len:84 (+) Transcript_22421:1-252(+)